MEVFDLWRRSCLWRLVCWKLEFLMMRRFEEEIPREELEIVDFVVESD